MKKLLDKLFLPILCVGVLTGCAIAVEPTEENFPMEGEISMEENISMEESSSAGDTAAPAGSAAASDKPPVPDTPEALAEPDATPALQVSGTHLEDAQGNVVQLYGMSTHGLSWFPQFVTYETFETLRDDWNTNCVRLAMYSAEYNGYCTGGDKEALKSLVKSGVQYATELDMYVIIDWHVLGDQDPNVYKTEAVAFFEEMSAEFAEYDNVLYEICNEPNGYATWEHVKSYADEVIPVIRENDPDCLIIVGTPFWCQEIDKAAADPLPYENLLYSLHFYAASHKDDLRSRMEACLEDGLPIFVSEFGTCDASGNGANDFDSTSQWLELIEKYDVSFCCWNLSNKQESSSVISPNTDKVSGWTEEELSESGRWIREYFRSR